MSDLPVIDISAIWTPPTIDDVRSIVLPFIATDENPVTDWHSGAILRTMYELEAFILQDLVGNMFPGIVANGYPDTDDGPSQDIVGRGWFGTDRIAATAATQTITLACDGGHGPYPIAAGRLYKATDDTVYQGLAGGTLATGGTLTFDVGATALGAARGLVNRLSSPLPGVTVQAAIIKVLAGVPQYGSDAEANATYRARYTGRFIDMDGSDIPELDRLEAWALKAGTSTTRARVYADATVQGGLVLVLANGTGGIPSGEVTTVQNYVLARCFDDVTSEAASNANVTAGGVVLYPADWNSDQLAAAKTAADAAWIGGLGSARIGSFVPLSLLNQVVMDQGAVDFTGKTLNGSGVDLALASGTVPVAAGSLGAELSWEPY